jgi:hypothetical protein
MSTADFPNDVPSPTYLKELAKRNVDKIVIPQEKVQETRQLVQDLGIPIQVDPHREKEKIKSEQEHEKQASDYYQRTNQQTIEKAREDYERLTHKRRFF